ncbi:aspartate/glutamate racemase family protein [Candidatus Beckwithbacteria bacterium]|nr:aspartate/glutamate racemase family protein [Candidatus Beckwithbacteria bacterium]
MRQVGSIFGVANNNDYPEIIIDSIPVPDFISNKRNEKKALHILQDRVLRLSQIPVSYLAVACNTAHLLLSDLQNETNKPFVSMIDAVVNEIKLRAYKRIGLLASPTTIQTKLYQDKMNQNQVKVVLPSQTSIKKLGKIIKRIINGEVKESKRELVAIANELTKRKVDAIILGCTELPLVFPKKYVIPSINSLDVLARALIVKYYFE